MKKAKMISMICYGLVALGSMVIGVRYLLADQIMSYHLQALGTSWEAMAAGPRIMTLSFMKAGGLGFFITGLAVAILLAMPFRRGEAWSRWALGAITIVDSAVMTALIYNIQANTAANPPLMPTALTLLVSLAAFAVSFGVRPSPEG